MTKHFNITISGKVQNVFFRAQAQMEAKRLGLSGFTRNEQNGELYIEAEGASDALTTFLEWCSHGPKEAAVASIRIEESPVKNISGFEIRK